MNVDPEDVDLAGNQQSGGPGDGDGSSVAMSADNEQNG